MIIFKVTQNSPSYALTIGSTDPSGFHDMIGSEINEAVGLSDEAAPDNENEAILSNEEAGSSYME